MSTRESINVIRAIPLFTNPLRGLELIIMSSIKGTPVHMDSARIFACMQRAASVESRKGARPGPTGSRLFPFPAHQTGHAQLEHPAFRLVSPQRPPSALIKQHRATALE